MGKNLKGKELGKGLGQRKDGRYEARAIINGERIVLYDFNLNKLKQRFEFEKEKAKRRNVTECPDVTVMEWFNSWFENYKKPTLKESGISVYKRKFVNTYGEQLGAVKLTDLKQINIQAATKNLVDKGYKPKYIRDGLAVFKGMLDSAVGNGIILTNPSLGVIVPTYNEVKEERRVLSQKEQEKFLKQIESSYYKELYHFMLLTGLRVGEVGALQWCDIDFLNEFVIVRHTLSCQYEGGVKNLKITTPKTKNSFRKIPFFGETKEILLSQKQKQTELKKELGSRWRQSKELGDVDLVFTSSMGSPVTRYVLEHDMRQISKNMRTLEVYDAITNGRETEFVDDIHPHALRHTFATRCFEKGMNVETVQKILGHANINMTMTYTHVLENVLKSEAKKMGNFLENPSQIV